MFVKRVHVFYFLVSIILLSACSLPQPIEPTAPPIVEPTATATPTPTASAPMVGPIRLDGESELRVLDPTIEVVSNCGGGSSVAKNISMSVATSHAVEWEVGGMVGVGVVIGEGVVPGGVNLSSALEGHYATQLDQGFTRTVSWELSTEPDTVAEYTLSWREVWQPGYVEITLADQSVIKVRVRYRAGIQSDMEGKRVVKCGIVPIPTQVYPTETPQVYLTETPQVYLTETPQVYPTKTPQVYPTETPQIGFNVCKDISAYPGFLRYEDGIPPGTTMEITVRDGEIHAVTGGTMSVAGVNLNGGKDRGSVVVLLPSATPYNITKLNPTWNWYGTFNLEANRAKLLADVLAAQQMIPGTCSSADGCSFVDVLVVGPNGVVSQEEKYGPLNRCITLP